MEYISKYPVIQETPCHCHCHFHACIPADSIPATAAQTSSRLVEKYSHTSKLKHACMRVMFVPFIYIYSYYYYYYYYFSSSVSVHLSVCVCICIESCAK